MTSLWDIQSPPNDYELEQRILCSMMTYPDLLDWTAIQSEDFFQKSHRIIFDTLVSMRNDSKDITPWTLESELKKSYKRKSFWIEEISWMMVGSSWHADDEIRLIWYSKAREVIQQWNSIIMKCYDKWDVSEISPEVDSILSTISSADTSKVTMVDLMTDAIDALDRPPEYITAWYDKLNDILWWFTEGQLVIIAWRPWAWKTAAMLNMAYQQAVSWVKVWMFSLEMSTQELLFRMFSLSTGIPFWRIQSRAIKQEDKEKIAEKSMEIMNKMDIVDNCFTLTQIKNKAKSMVKVHWCKIIYIDYLQLISNGKPTSNRNNEVSILTRDLKMLAKQLWVPILLWSQLNRAVEARVDKRPHLADLRDSGSIEQDADCVIMLHRDDYYDIDSPPNWQMDFLIRKHRNWPVWEPMLYFDAPTMCIHNEKETPF